MLCLQCDCQLRTHLSPLSTMQQSSCMYACANECPVPVISDSFISFYSFRHALMQRRLSTTAVSASGWRGRQIPHRAAARSAALRQGCMHQEPFSRWRRASVRWAARAHSAMLSRGCEQVLRSKYQSRDEAWMRVTGQGGREAAAATRIAFATRLTPMPGGLPTAGASVDE